MTIVTNKSTGFDAFFVVPQIFLTCPQNGIQGQQLSSNTKLLSNNYVIDHLLEYLRRTINQSPADLYRVRSSSSILTFNKDSYNNVVQVLSSFTYFKSF